MIYEYQNDSPIKSKEVILFFYAAYNSNCSINKEILEKISLDFPNIVFFKINTTSFSNIKKYYNVIRIPTYIYLKNGIEIGRLNGNSSSYTIKTFIKKFKEDR